MLDVFIVLDTESRGYIRKDDVEEFALLRCPVFKRRDCIIEEFESSTSFEEDECDGHDSNILHDDDDSEEVQENVCDDQSRIEIDEEDCWNPYGDDDDTKEDQSISLSKKNQDVEQNISIQRQDEQDIFNCILGEDFHSASDNDLSSKVRNEDEKLQGEDTILVEGGESSIGVGKEGGGSVLKLNESTRSISTKNSIRNNDASKKKKRSQTFEEIWDAVIRCRLNQDDHSDDQRYEFFGIEAWMVFCRFISLAQYQDANRRFSAMHLQQKIESHKNLDSNEVILVDVPPPERPIPLSTQNLIEYELSTLDSEVNTHTGNIGIALPELDLDHSHLFLHDGPNNKFKATQRVYVSVFGSDTPTTNTTDGLEFLIRLKRNMTYEEDTDNSIGEEISVVRRSYADLSWLHGTFKSQKHVSGYLCGRIIPPFPSPLGYSKATDSDNEKTMNSSAAISVASESAVIVTSAAKSLFGQLSKSASKLKAVTKLSLKSSQRDAAQTNQSLISTPCRHQGSSMIRKRHTNVKESILDNPSSKAKQLERYLNYMLDHQAMSTSFPLNVILRVSFHSRRERKRLFL